MNWFDWCMGVGTVGLCGSMFVLFMTEWQGLVILVLASAVLIIASAAVMILLERRQMRQRESAPKGSRIEA